MIPEKSCRVLLLVVLSAFVSFIPARAALAQDSSPSTQTASGPPRESEVNLDAQLYLILATNKDIEEGAIPVSLNSIVKQLRESLTFKHYGLAATMVNRVRNNGHLDVSWIGGPFVLPASTLTSNPSLSQFTAVVRVVTDENGKEVIRLNDFRFGTRVPLVMSQPGATVASTGAGVIPMISYEPIGLRTDISVREGVPVVAGTLNMGPSGDALIVVIAARRAN